MSKEKALKLINEYLAKQEPQKVELSLLSDAQGLANKLDGLFGDTNRSFNIEGNKMLDKIMPKIKEFNETRQDLIRQADKFVSEAEAIGIDRKTIDNSMRKINQSLKMAKKLSDAMNDKVRDLRRVIF